MVDTVFFRLKKNVQNEIVQKLDNQIYLLDFQNYGGEDY